MGFHWNLSDSKSPEVYRTLLSILADLNNAVVWMVSTHSVNSKSFSLCINPLVTVSRAPITIGIIVTFLFHSFFNSFAKSRYLSFFTLSILLCGQLGQQSPPFCKISFLLIIIRSGCLAEISWFVCNLKS